MKLFLFITLGIFALPGASSADPTGGGAWSVIDERARDAGGEEASSIDLTQSGFELRPVRILGQISADESDWYRIDLASYSHLQFRLNVINEGASLETILARGEEWSREGGTSFEYAGQTGGRYLAPGTYYFRIKNNSGQATFYNIFLSGEIGFTVPVDTAGNDRETARDLGGLTQRGDQIIHEGWVDPDADALDVFTFEYKGESPREIAILLDGLAADLDISLTLPDGTEVYSSGAANADPETIKRVLAPGIYMLQVYGYSGTSNYRLNILVGEEGPLPPPEGREEHGGEGDERG